jgi:hypothetical protein
VKDGRVSDANTALLDRPLLGDQVAYAKSVREHWDSWGGKRVDPT